MLFVITGPSGCGKSTLVKRVRDDIKNIDFSVSYTTRIKRDSEIEEEDYYFVTKKKFKEMIEEDMFAEWAVVHGEYYGTSRREIEKKATMNDLLLDIDVQGAEQIKARHKKAAFVFILPPGFKALKKRLEKRGHDSAQDIQKRLEVAKKEIRYYPMFDYIIINDKLDQAAEELKSVIISKRCLLDVRQKEIIPILQSFSEEG
jgi:guanylate kinase